MGVWGRAGTWVVHVCERAAAGWWFLADACNKRLSPPRPSPPRNRAAGSSRACTLRWSSCTPTPSRCLTRGCRTAPTSLPPARRWWSSAAATPAPTASAPLCAMVRRRRRRCYRAGEEGTGCGGRSDKRERVQAALAPLFRCAPAAAPRTHRRYLGRQPGAAEPAARGARPRQPLALLPPRVQGRLRACRGAARVRRRPARLRGAHQALHRRRAWQSQGSGAGQRGLDARGERRAPQVCRGPRQRAGACEGRSERAACAAFEVSLLTPPLQHPTHTLDSTCASPHLTLPLLPAPAPAPPLPALTD